MAQDYLGTALKYPIQISELGRVRISSGIDVVKEGILQLLNTPVGTRFFNPDYGCRIHELLFEPSDEVLTNMLEFFITDAIEDWEKRVLVEAVQTTLVAEEYRVECFIQLRLLASNEPFDLIYPFYRELKN